MSDIVSQIVAFLGPFLPFLLRMGETAAETASQELGREAWQDAKRMWTRLDPQVRERPAAWEAAEDLAKDPDDEDLRAAFKVQLRKVLAEDDTLRRWLEQVVEGSASIDARSGGVYIQGGQQYVAGDLIGRDKRQSLG